MAAGKKKVVGVKVKVVKPTGDVPVGHIGLITYAGNGVYRVEGSNCNLASNAIMVVPDTFSRNSLLKEKAELETKTAILDSKIAFLDEIESESGDEKEFRVDTTLTLVENANLTKREKSKAIAALLEE